MYKKFKSFKARFLWGPGDTNIYMSLALYPTHIKFLIWSWVTVPYTVPRSSRTQTCNYYHWAEDNTCWKLNYS